MCQVRQGGAAGSLAQFPSTAWHAGIQVGLEWEGLRRSSRIRRERQQMVAAPLSAVGIVRSQGLNNALQGAERLRHVSVSDQIADVSVPVFRGSAGLV